MEAPVGRGEFPPGGGMGCKRTAARLCVGAGLHVGVCAGGGTGTRHGSTRQSINEILTNQ